MGDKQEIPESWRTAAHFRYQAATGKVHGVRAQPRPPEGDNWLWYFVRVRPPGSPEREACRAFSISDTVKAMLEGGGAARREEFNDLLWVRRLRRLALDVTMGELDADRQTQDEFAVGLEQRELLDRFAFRDCEFQQALPNGDLVCTAGADGDCATTRAICEACGMPDPWERCKHARHVRTQAVTSDSKEGVLKRLCEGQCMLGKSPGGRRGPGRVPRRGERTRLL